ncbi:hypothetical protein JCM9743_17750 [Natrinema sp. JCM 9743]
MGGDGRAAVSTAAFAVASRLSGGCESSRSRHEAVPRGKWDVERVGKGWGGGDSLSQIASYGYTLEGVKYGF